MSDAAPDATADTNPATASDATLTQGFSLAAPPAGFIDDPYPVYAALRRHSPVHALGPGSFLLTRHADLLAAYRSAHLSSDKQREFAPRLGPGTPIFEHHTTSLVFNDPPLHTRVRKLIMGALTRRAIADMEPGLITLVDGLLDAIEARGGGDLIEDFASAIPVEVIGNLLGVPHADRGPLRGWSLAILGALEPRLTPAQEALGNHSVTEFTAYLGALITERRQHPGDPQQDVLTRLIQGEGLDANDQTMGEQLGEAELLQNCVFILNAGHETTTNLIGNALVSLQEWPEAKVGLLQKMKQTIDIPQGLEANFALAVDEFLRFESSNQLSNRRAVKSCTLGDISLEAGALLTLCIGAANRDPAQFGNPNVLNLARGDERLGEPANRHLAFGYGIHQCAGLSLARLEGRIAIGRFLMRFPNYRLTAAPRRGGRARFRGFLQAPFSMG